LLTALPLHNIQPAGMELDAPPQATIVPTGNPSLDAFAGVRMLAIPKIENADKIPTSPSFFIGCPPCSEQKRFFSRIRTP
jgi:hypothetical protein